MPFPNYIQINVNLKIDNANLALNCRKLAIQDANLAVILDSYGTPPLWARDGGFSTLIRIILEQQVSLSSAQAAFERCREIVGEITPEAILSLSDDQMKSAYFSRQKMSYARNLADAVVEKSLNFENLEEFSDDDVRAELMKINGIGRWTADIYLLMAMSRPDIMPVGDLALHVSWQKLLKLEKRPQSEEFVQIAKRWKPFRSIAARLLWHYYLSLKSQK